MSHKLLVIVVGIFIVSCTSNSRDLRESFENTDNIESLYSLGNIEEVYNILVDKKELTEVELLILIKSSIYLGDYATAEYLLNNLDNKDYIEEKERLLSIIFYHNNRYQNSREFIRETNSSTLVHIMRLFDDSPYKLKWNAESQTTIPFLSEFEDSLPHVHIEINGIKTIAYIDTGEDQLSIPVELANEFSLSETIDSTGIYAGGKSGSIKYTKIDTLKLGDVEISNLPVVFNNEEIPCIGTGILRQFISTIDYPDKKLILRNRDIDHESIISEDIFHEIKFGYVDTHYLFCHLKINESENLHFLFDTGLDSDQAGAISSNTFDVLNISKPFMRIPVIGQGGSGTELYFVGVTEVESIAMGTYTQKNQELLSGIFPEQLYYNEKFGFIVDGLISQKFIEKYACTFDFDRRIIYLSK